MQQRHQLYRQMRRQTKLSLSLVNQRQQPAQVVCFVDFFQLLKHNALCLSADSSVHQGNAYYVSNVTTLNPFSFHLFSKADG